MSLTPGKKPLVQTKIGVTPTDASIQVHTNGFLTGVRAPTLATFYRVCRIELERWWSDPDRASRSSASILADECGFAHTEKAGDDAAVLSGHNKVLKSSP